MTRPICEIAEEIQSLWPISKTHSAKPYLLGMLRLKTMHDFSGLDSPKDIISVFLSLASGFVGSDADRIKAELKAMVDSIPRTRETVKGLSMGVPELSKA